MTVVTISRQLGSLGNEIADALSRKLSCEIITRDRLITDFLPAVANRYELSMLAESSKFWLRDCLEGISFIDYIRKELYSTSSGRNLILVGFGSQILFAGHPDVIRVRIVSSQEIRADRIRRKYNISVSEALTILDSSDRRQKRFVSIVFGQADISDPLLYDLFINTTFLTADEYASSIAELVREHDARRRLELLDKGDERRSNRTSMTVFKNPEESEFARILDTYNIEWIYEPKTFPVEWDTDGNVKLAFSPDFYLPGLDLYIELTIMNQKYVTEKNKKVKRLKELYPGTNVRIVYKKDFQTLIERFSELGAG